jgi:hydroxyacylglutathione hydrolase
MHFLDDTKVYCGHEYTVANLTFGSLVDEENEALREKLAWAIKQREQGENTIPGTIGNEKQTNVFMRTNVLKGKLNQANAIDAMNELRTMKNNGLPKK